MANTLLGVSVWQFKVELKRGIVSNLLQLLIWWCLIFGKWQILLPLRIWGCLLKKTSTLWATLFQLTIRLELIEKALFQPVIKIELVCVRYIMDALTAYGNDNFAQTTGKVITCKGTFLVHNITIALPVMSDSNRSQRDGPFLLRFIGSSDRDLFSRSHVSSWLFHLGSLNFLVFFFQVILFTF